jgi:hypothetical protein
MSLLRNTGLKSRTNSCLFSIYLSIPSHNSQYWYSWWWTRPIRTLFSRNTF